MMHKPKNDLQEQQERAEKNRRKYFSEQRAKMIKRRTGLTHKNHTLIIRGITIQQIVGAPVIVRERWCRQPLGRSYHFMLLRYTLRTTGGDLWTALQAQTHDANRGYMLSITGFWDFKPA